MHWLWLALFVGLACQAAVTFVGGSAGRVLALAAVVAFILGALLAAVLT